MAKKKSKSSPKNSTSSLTSSGNGGNQHNNHPTSTTTTAPGVVPSSSVPAIMTPQHDHDNIKVEVYDDLIRSDVEAMMMSSSTGSSNNTSSKDVKWIGSIDQGTSSTRFMIFNQNGQIIGMAQIEHEQIYPQPSWHEHDPIQIWKNTIVCMTTVARTIQSKLSTQQNDFLFRPIPSSSTTAITTTTTSDNDVGDEEQQQQQQQPTTTATTNRFLAAIGVTNQRETIICWNRITGRPYYNAIVWDDARTASIVNDIVHTNQNTSNIQYITQTTGLPISTYFAATKMKWLLDNVEQIRYDIQHHNTNVCFGTIDTWLLYQLTGQVPKSETTGRPLKGNAGLCNIGGIYKTDVTNASRWLLMNLATCQWDTKCISTICTPYDTYISIQHNLPEICPSSYLFGHVHVHCGIPSTMYGNIPIAGILGDQQAALFGQAAHTKGTAKNTYGTGLFLMMNTGPQIVPPPSTHGLLTTVAYQIGIDGPIYYAYEGSVSHSGSTIQWLRDQIGIISDASESETLARTTSNNEGLYMVPAFGGLLAPHWRNDARGCIVGITASHHKGHICRAALEATAYQTKDVFDAIIKDSNIQISSLNVDGGGTYNKLLMQFQADILNVKVIRPKVMETTSIGVAFAAGLTIGVWKDVNEIQQLWSIDTVYVPQMSTTTRNKYISGWEKALSKSFNWVTNDYEILDKNDTKQKETINDDGGASKDNVDLGSSWMVVPKNSTTTTIATATATTPDMSSQQTAAKSTDIVDSMDVIVEDVVTKNEIGEGLVQTNEHVDENIDEPMLTEERAVYVGDIIPMEDTPISTTVETKNFIEKQSVDDTIDSKSKQNIPSPTTTSGSNIATLITTAGIAFGFGMLLARKR
jgi:glycerol kinase